MNPNSRSPVRDVMTTLALIGIVCYVLYMIVPSLQQGHYLKPINDGAGALQANDLPKARRLFASALQKKPNDPSVYEIIVQTCILEKQPALGVEYAEQAIRTCKDASADSRCTLYGLLSALYTETEPAHPQTKAIQAAREALALAPNDPLALNAVGYLLADNDENLDEAERDIARALRGLAESSYDEQQTRFVIEDSYGWVEFKKGDYARAIDALQQAVLKIPSGASPDISKALYYHLGAAFARAGKPEEARRAFNVVFQYDPKFAPARAEFDALPPQTGK